MKKEIERFYKKLSKIKTDNPPAEIQAHHNFKRKKRIKKDKFGICLKQEVAKQIRKQLTNFKQK